MIRHYDLGWYTKIPDRSTGLSVVTSIRLLSRGEFTQIFPEATIFDEKFLGLVKSFVAYTPK